MKSIFYIALLLAALPVAADAQAYKPLTKEEAAPAMERITAVSEAIETLECSFSEEKKMTMLAQSSVSKGVMYYIRPDRIRWEYVEPVPYLFVVNGAETTVKANGRIERGNAPSVMVFREVGKLILGSVSGKKIVDETRFDAAYEASEANFRIVMTPKEKRMKQMMARIVFTFSLKDNYIRTIEMSNAAGDLTTITFVDKKVNKPVDEAVFKLQ